MTWAGPFYLARGFRSEVRTRRARKNPISRFKDWGIKNTFLLKNKATKLLKIRGSVPESDKTKPISDTLWVGRFEAKPWTVSCGPRPIEGVKKSPVPSSAAVPLDVRKACGFPATGPAHMIYCSVWCVERLSLSTHQAAKPRFFHTFRAFPRIGRQSRTAGGRHPPNWGGQAHDGT